MASGSSRPFLEPRCYRDHGFKVVPERPVGMKLAIKQGASYGECPGGYLVYLVDSLRAVDAPGQDDRHLEPAHDLRGKGLGVPRVSERQQVKSFNPERDQPSSFVD